MLQSALAPNGPEAAAIAGISWLLFIGAAVIFVAVMALAALAVSGRAPRLGRHGVIVAGGVVFPLVVLSALLVYTLVRGASLGAPGEPALRIAVTGHQWWWEIAYLRADGSVDFVTANELRLPVGQTVELLLRSGDVLHSFWVPALAGKLDLVPGKENRLRLAAARAGAWRGQCAEYCGGPHAQMAFYVIAAEAEAFEQWRAGQRLPAASGGDAQGRRLFLARCASCHTVRGTAAEGRLGPDLTHVASRVSLAAGILPNDTGTLRDWIASSQHVKPGNLMPSFAELGDAELQALAAYVGSLR
ncbi:MAG TPA: c-type cytochrome [Burkholderiales bacterium]